MMMKIHNISPILYLMLFGTCGLKPRKRGRVIEYHAERIEVDERFRHVNYQNGY